MDQSKPKRARAACAMPDCREQIDARTGGYRNEPGGAVYCSQACAQAAQEMFD